jgi:hypothetical protein
MLFYCGGVKLITKMLSIIINERVKNISRSFFVKKYNQFAGLFDGN